MAIINVCGYLRSCMPCISTNHQRVYGLWIIYVIGEYVVKESICILLRNDLMLVSYIYLIYKGYITFIS